MIDSVLKGTGNSRFLKSAVPAGTSWADALAMLQAGTFPIDFNGINTDGFQQVGTPLNKANLLKDATAAQIGLPPSTTPDGMFQALGNTGELHVWRKTVTTAQEIPAGYKLGDAESGTAFSVPNAGSKNYVTLQYGPSITVNDAGGVSLTSVTGSVQFQQYSNVSAIYDIRNNFVKAIPNGTDTSVFDGVIFVPNDCSFKNTAGIVTFGKFYRVNAYPKTPAGTTTTYPVSTNPNAYQEGDDAKEAGYVVGDVETGQFSLGVTVDSSAINRYNYSSAITANDDGTISLLNSSPIEINGGNSAQNNEAMAKIVGKYISLERVGDSNHPPDFDAGVVWFIPADATYGNKGSYPNNINYVTKRQPVTGYAAIPAGTTIEYLGKLGDKARVQVLSYVGTGTYGSSNPNSLTFGFAPKVAMYLGASEDNGSTQSSTTKRAMFQNELTINYISGFGFSLDTSNYPSYGKRSADGKTFYWYTTGAARHQLNESSYIYYFLALV